MINYTEYIIFDDNFKINEIHKKILDLALPNIIDYKRRFPEKKIVYLDDLKRFESINEIVLDSLLKDICILITGEEELTTKDIYIQQHYEVVNVLDNKKLTKEYLIKRLKDYSPILDKKEREEKFKKELNNYLSDSLFNLKNNSEV